MTTPYQIAERFIGMKEIPGTEDNPQVLAMLRLDADWPKSDEVPWCSAFLNYCFWLLRLPRTKSLRARSWLTVGIPVMLNEARAGYDVCIFKRPNGPGEHVIDAPGHAGLYASHTDKHVYVLGGNQSNRVSVARYPASRLLGVRRVAPPVFSTFGPTH